jgi:hypothetical protein
MTDSCSVCSSHSSNDSAYVNIGVTDTEAQHGGFVSFVLETVPQPLSSREVRKRHRQDSRHL